MYANGLQIQILQGEKDINFGAIYENAVAQELKAHGFDLYYFQSKKQGELDFVIEQNGSIIPIEVKSGKTYARHRALDQVLVCGQYGISEAIVFCNENVQVKNGRIFYCPIYMVGFLQREAEEEELLYSMDLSVLQ